MRDISAHMNEVSPLLQARATKLIRMLTVKKNPRWHRSRLSVKSASSEKKNLSLHAATGAARYETKPGFFFSLSLSLSSFHTKRSAGKKKKKKTATRRARFSGRYETDIRSSFFPPRGRASEGPSVPHSLPLTVLPVQQGEERKKWTYAWGGVWVVVVGVYVWVGGLVADPFTVTWETPCTFLQ